MFDFDRLLNITKEGVCDPINGPVVKTMTKHPNTYYMTTNILPTSLELITMAWVQSTCDEILQSVSTMSHMAICNIKSMRVPWVAILDPDLSVYAYNHFILSNVIDRDAEITNKRRLIELEASRALYLDKILRALKSISKPRWVYKKIIESLQTEVDRVTNNKGRDRIVIELEQVPCKVVIPILTNPESTEFYLSGQCNADNVTDSLMTDLLLLAHGESSHFMLCVVDTVTYSSRIMDSLSHVTSQSRKELWPNIISQVIESNLFCEYMGFMRSRKLRELSRRENDDLFPTRETESTTHQRSSYDCGFYCVLYLELILSGVDKTNEAWGCSQKFMTEKYRPRITKLLAEISKISK